MTDITASRRTVLTVTAALAAATIATGLAIAADPGACLMPDPIHAAMASHRTAAKAVDTAHAWMLTLEPTVAETDYSVPTAFMVEIGAIKAMIATSPTTRAGLQAFADYLRDERQHQVGMHVDQVRTLEDGRTYTMRDASGTEKLIARRAAELG